MDIWDFYFSTMVGWCMHPRNLEKDTRTYEQMINDAADVADLMIKIKENRNANSIFRISDNTGRSSECCK